jgi:hypothetical protein
MEKDFERARILKHHFDVPIRQPREGRSRREASIPASRQWRKIDRMGVKKTDELGLPAHTEATVKGLGLYKRYGIKEIGRSGCGF